MVSIVLKGNTTAVGSNFDFLQTQVFFSVLIKLWICNASILLKAIRKYLCSFLFFCRHRVVTQLLVFYVTCNLDRCGKNLDVTEKKILLKWNNRKQVNFPMHSNGKIIVAFLSSINHFHGRHLGRFRTTVYIMLL